MSVQSQTIPSDASPSDGLGPDQLAELIATFTDATSRLQQTHETLRAEVARLEGELRETKGQLARARELAALGEMAAGIAHEIRNPLGSIKLYAKVLVDDLADREQERDTARKIARAVDGLNAVVGDVLAFSREMRLETTAVCLRGVVERAMECCADRIAMSDIDVDLRLDDAGEAEVDPTLVHQALVNVLRNACDALAERDGGCIRVSTGCRSVLDHDGVRRTMAMVLVEDSGPGIPEEVRSRVFNPFFTTRAAGTGLGLPIVHRILDAHDGRITITNGAPGLGGARVELLFPRPKAHHDTNHQGEAA
ncbi:MAG: hypothetical protein Tsb0013_12630 [Phycisphaerales bacterium]